MTPRTVRERRGEKGNFASSPTGARTRSARGGSLVDSGSNGNSEVADDAVRARIQSAREGCIHTARVRTLDFPAK
eukprot:scaffold570808_cov36-Prasinocladus_malaysianus.AAC.1